MHFIYSPSCVMSGLCIMKGAVWLTMEVEKRDSYILISTSIEYITSPIYINRLTPSPIYPKLKKA
jgi:hypothetical protein